MELVSFIENIILHEDLMNPNLYHACVHTHLNTGNKIVLVTLCVTRIYSCAGFQNAVFTSCHVRGRFGCFYSFILMHNLISMGCSKSFYV